MSLDANAQKKEAHSSAQLRPVTHYYPCCCSCAYQHHLNVWFESLLILDLTKQSDVDILWVPLLKILFSCASFFSIIFYLKKNEGDLYACFWIMRIEIVVSFCISILARLVFGFDGDD